MYSEYRRNAFNHLSTLLSEFPEKVINGKEHAQNVRAYVAQQAKQLEKKIGYKVKLAVILVGSHPSSKIYVANKQRACLNVGMASETYHLPYDVSPQELHKLIETLNQDDSVHGILLQMPLPEPLNAVDFMAHIKPEKDVDGLSPYNLGYLFMGSPKITPCTPKGCMHLIESVRPSLVGARAVVIGRSTLVGKPVALLLSARNATVTTAHSKTQNLKELCREADVLVVAVGSPGFITGEYIKPGATVIDVGITHDESGAILGDVDLSSVLSIAGHVTPVPGGVGPMTVAYLLHNTVTSAAMSVQKVEVL